MVEPLSVDPKREFRITGNIVRVMKDVDETNITIRHVDYSRYEDNITDFSIRFSKPKAKVFVDKYVKADDLVICIGEIGSDKDGHLFLEGCYAMAFRGMEEIWKVPDPIHIDPDDVPDEKDNAY